MSNSNNSEPGVRANADQRRLDLGTLGDGGVIIIIIKGNVSESVKGEGRVAMQIGSASGMRASP